MRFADLFGKRYAKEKFFLNEKEKYVMTAIWDDDEDLSIYEIMMILHTNYQKDFESTIIERSLFQLSKKGYVDMYIHRHLLFVRCLITKETYSERGTKILLQLQEKYRDIFRWDESQGALLTKREAQELRELFFSEDDKK